MPKNLTRQVTWEQVCKENPILCIDLVLSSKERAGEQALEKGQGTLTKLEI